MKKTIATLLTMGLAFSMAACGSSNTPAETTESAVEETTETATEEASASEDTTEATDDTEEAAEATTEEAAEATTEEAAEDATEEAAAGDTVAVSQDDLIAEFGDVKTHDDYIAAAVDEPVTIQAFVMDKQGWWEEDGVGKATFYTQDENGGAYFIYNMPCSQADYDALSEGTNVMIGGYKAEWSGEVEIVDAKFAFGDGSTKTFDPEDITALLADDSLIDHQNEYVSFKGMTVEPSTDADGNEVAFLYNWDGSGSQGDDLYFNVSVDGNTYNFTVESYLRGKDSDVYKAVEGLNIGDVVDMEGYLYWYEGVNPHIISVTVK